MKKTDAIRWFLLRHPLLFAAWRLALSAIGKVCFFWMKPKVKSMDVIACAAMIRPADLIGVRSRRYLTSYLIPGKYKHTAIYLGHGYVAHAVSPKVVKENLQDFLKQYDGFKLIRPAVPFNWRAADRAVFQRIGTGYDFYFDSKNEAMYCHELGAKALEAGGLQPMMRGDCWAFSDLEECCITVMEVE